MAAAATVQIEPSPPRSTRRPLGYLRAGTLVALLLLVAGEAAPGLFPLRIVIEARDGQVSVETDGGRHTFDTSLYGAWTRVALRSSYPTQREFQVDGSDVTSRQDRDPDEIRAMETSPLYQIAAWLRDEDSYSRWEHVRLVNLNDGQVIAEGVGAVDSVALPVAFRLEADLRRPEALVAIDVVSDAPTFHGVVELSRDRRAISWSDGPRGSHQVDRWFFPEEPAPFAAELMQLLGRSAAAVYALLAMALCGGWLLRRVLPGNGQRWSHIGPQQWFVVSVSAVWLVAASWVTVQLYHQLPHIVDASAYYFETSIFRSGKLWFEPPPMVDAFKGYFETATNGRWFAQYPPGAPVLYALGNLVGLGWLVGPLGGLVLILATALAARLFFGSAAGFAALGLGAISPFILFQAGSFMSHPISGAALAGALAAFAYAERRQKSAWYAACGALLGWGVLTRELSAVLVAIPLVGWLLIFRRWHGVVLLAVGGIPFAVAFVAYNAMVTGDPFLLPRNAVDPFDRYGFGSYGPTHHSFGSGLIYTLQNLELLQFDLFGWPPVFALSLLLVPFLLGRAGRYDVLCASGLLVYMAGYVGVPGAGIVLGPRYYYEALPWILLLAVRGVQVLAMTLASFGLSQVAARGGTVLVIGLLSLSTALFYDPHLIERRTDYFAMDHNRGVKVPFVQNTLFGPRLIGFDGPTLVIVPDVVVFKTLSALNCPDLSAQHVQECPVLFAQAGRDDAPDVIDALPGRTVLTTQLSDGTLTLKPYQCDRGRARC